jgi:hypothetical protein
LRLRVYGTPESQEYFFRPPAPRGTILPEEDGDKENQHANLLDPTSSSAAVGVGGKNKKKRAEDTILIGRHSKCHVKIDNAVLSKFQCFLKYDHQNQEWWIQDGMESGKRSMNGTWLYLQEEHEL